MGTWLLYHVARLADEGGEKAIRTDKCKCIPSDLAESKREGEREVDCK